MPYTTCALAMNGGGDASQPGLNPFTRDEYRRQCTDTARPARAVCAMPTAADLPAGCARDVDGVIALDDRCLGALRGAQPISGARAPNPSDPMFDDAELCRTRLGGTYRTFCGAGAGDEVTLDRLRTSIGNDCEQCCATLLASTRGQDEPPAAVAASHQRHHGATPRVTGAHAHGLHDHRRERPLFFPFMH